MGDPMSDEQDQLYLKLHKAREALCLAQRHVPAHWTSDLSQAIAIIDNVGSSLVPIWSKDNQPEYPEPKT